MSKSRDEQSEAFLNSDTLSDDFFSSIVQKKLNIDREKFKVKLVMLSPATGKNENFVSVVYRAKIKIEMLDTKQRQHVDTIIKVLLTTLKEFKEFSVFPRERFLYEDIITSYERIWMERAKEFVQFAPKCLKVDTDPYELMVLDDLKANSYEMMDKRVGLNAAQTKIALSRLAKFHAASAVRYREDGQLQNFLVRRLTFDPTVFTEDSPMGKNFQGIFHSYIKSIKSYGDCDIYADKIAKWDKNKFFNCWIDVAEPMRCGFTVLAHGDFWVNNMMFKLNESNEPEDLIMLDFQACAWASPSLDLHYFFTSSVSDEVKIDCYDEFVRYYHEELVEALEKVGYDQYIPTLEEIFEDLLEKSSMAIQSSFFIMFVTKYESAEEINIEDLMTKGATAGDEFYERIYCNETYKKALKLWLEFFDKRGYLDSLRSENGMSNGL